MVQSVGFCRKELWDFMENITYFVNRIGISLIHTDTSFKNIQLMFMGVHGISRYFLGSEVRHILSRKLTFYKKKVPCWLTYVKIHKRDKYYTTQKTYICWLTYLLISTFIPISHILWPGSLFNTDKQMETGPNGYPLNWMVHTKK